MAFAHADGHVFACGFLPFFFFGFVVGKHFGAFAVETRPVAKACFESSSVAVGVVESLCVHFGLFYV